jgi:hypothetical protein
MSANAETGHAKSIANFENLVTIAINHGAGYAPSNPNIVVTNLQLALSNARTALTTLKNNFNTWKSATNDREIAFEPLRNLSTQLLNVLISTGVPAQTIKDYKTINAKIQGAKISKDDPVEPATGSGEEEATENLPAKKSISASQRSYDNLVDHFEKAVILLSSVSAFTPTEQDLNSASLQTRFSNLQTLNTAAFNSANMLGNARINRDKLLYTNPDSLYELAKALRAYIKGKYGASSPEYRQVTALRIAKSVRD